MRRGRCVSGAELRRRPTAGHGHREPHAGLVLRPGRHLRRGRRARRPWTAPSTRAPTSWTSAASRPGRATTVDAVEEIRRTVGLRRRGARRFPDAGDQRRHVARTRSAGVCCEAGADLLNDAWGGVDPRAGAWWPRSSVPALVCTHAGGLAAADPPAPGGVRRRHGGRRRSGRSRRGGACRRARRAPRRRSSSTPATTSARTPATPSRRPGGSASWWPPAGRCSSRCPTRTSSGETLDRPVGERLVGTLGDDRGLGVARARACSAPTTSAETRETLDMVASIRGTRPPAIARRGLA